MRIMKGLVLSLLSLLLFLSLSVFGMAFALNITLLNTDFVVAEVDKLDMPALTRQLADTLIIPQLPQDMAFLKNPIYASVADFSPSLKEQLKTGIRSAYDYFQGRSQKLGLTISLDPLKTSLRDRARQAFLQNLPPQLAGLPPALVDQYFNQVYQQYSQVIPPSFTLDETTMGTQALAQVRQVKQYVGYFPLVYWGLIAFMLLLIAGIILINRDVKKVTRELGVNLLIYGVFGYASILATRYLIGQYLDPVVSSLSSSLAMPQALLSWLSQVTDDVAALTPLQVFSLSLLAIGIVLVVISFVYRPRRTEGETAHPI